MDEVSNAASQDAQTDLANLLPASYRTAEDDLTAPGPISEAVDAELDLSRLTAVHDYLWLAGRPMPPRPLHQQLLLKRQIAVTEKLDLHLVWGHGRIFIKPLPRFLLEPRFWNEHLQCRPPAGARQSCVCGGRRERALGFLFSYAALIANESDFHIAKDSRLLPPEVAWQAWRTLVGQVLAIVDVYQFIDPRFCYGELRLSRLNKIYYFWKTPLRGYVPRWNQYGSFFQDNITWLASSTVYMAVVLTAMQVGLATELQANAAFRSASSGFAVFSILVPLIVLAIVICVLCYLVVHNWIATRRYLRQRLVRMTGSKL